MKCDGGTYCGVCARSVMAQGKLNKLDKANDNPKVQALRDLGRVHGIGPKFAWTLCVSCACYRLLLAVSGWLSLVGAVPRRKNLTYCASRYDKHGVTSVAELYAHKEMCVHIHSRQRGACS